VGNQPEANTGKSRPSSARLMFASPATFACNNNNNLLMIMLYCKHQSLWSGGKSGWQVWKSKPRSSRGQGKESVLI